MNKKIRAAVWIVLASLMMGSSGCALIGTALAAGASYGIYQAMNK